MQVAVREQRQFSGELVPAASAAPPAAQPFLLGARPKARLFAPAAPGATLLLFRLFKQADRTKADKRDQCLQAMFLAAVLCGSDNQVFGAFTMQDALVSHWSAPEQGHVVQPKEPLLLRAVLALCKTGASATGAV